MTNKNMRYPIFGMMHQTKRYVAWTAAIFAALMMVGASAHGATVVHDAARDLMLNSASANVYTNFYGGMWSYMRASSNVGTRTLLPGVRVSEGPETDATGSNYPGASDLKIVWQRGPAKGSSSSPRISVNPTAWSDNNTYIRGAAWPLIPPGGLSCHPGNVTDEGNQCVVLRFTAPRNGTYTVTAKAWNQNRGDGINSGWTAVTLLVNGAVRRERIAWRSTPTAVTTNDFSLAAATYAAGDTIELAVDGNGYFDANATGLEFKIAEEVLDVMESSMAFRANVTSSTPSNPFTDAFGTWTTGYCDTNAVIGLGINPLTNGYARITQGGGLLGMAFCKDGTLQLPYMVVNPTDSITVETNASGKATTAQGRGFLPGEIVTQMGDWPFASTALEVVPSDGGVYDVGLSVRDISCSDRSDATRGVNVWLMQGGATLGKMYVSVEVGPSSDGVFLRDVNVLPQIPFQVIVDNNGKYASDGTGIMLAFVKKGERRIATWDANAAMITNMASATPSNPFDYNGATWEVGTCVGGWNGTFTRYSVKQTGRYSGTMSGWGQTADSSPFILANMAGRIISTGETGTSITSPVCIDALCGHPKSDNSATAIRFTAPTDGVYAATMWAADLSSGAGDSALDNGVDVHVAVNGRDAASSLINARASVAISSSCKLVADRLCLTAGETVTFAIGSNGYYGQDMTALYAWIEQDAEASGMSRVNVDLDGMASGEAAATFSGAGRVGFAGETWNGVRVADGSSNVESRQLYLSDGTDRTGVQMTVVRADGEIAASASGTATDTMAASLFTDGIVSSNTTDAYSFALTGLLPDTIYELYFYSRALDGATVVNGVFEVCGADVTATRTWFAGEGGDYARINARSDANGAISGTFRSASEASAFWNGLQILGPGFTPYVAKGTIIIFR